MLNLMSMFLNPELVHDVTFREETCSTTLIDIMNTAVYPVSARLNVHFKTLKNTFKGLKSLLN